MNPHNQILHTGAGGAILRLTRRNGSTLDVKLDVRDIPLIQHIRWTAQRDEVVARSERGEGFYVRLGAFIMQSGEKMVWRVKKGFDYRRRNLSLVQINESRGSVFYSKAHKESWIAKLSRRGVVVTRSFSVRFYGRNAERMAREALSRMLGLKQSAFEQLRHCAAFNVRRFFALAKARGLNLMCDFNDHLLEMILDARLTVHEWLRDQLAAEDYYAGNAEYAGCAVDIHDGSFAQYAWEDE